MREEVIFTAAHLGTGYHLLQLRLVSYTGTVKHLQLGFFNYYHYWLANSKCSYIIASGKKSIFFKTKPFCDYMNWRKEEGSILEIDSQ